VVIWTGNSSMMLDSLSRKVTSFGSPNSGLVTKEKARVFFRKKNRPVATPGTGPEEPD
jgi:hypothetical protein